MANQKESKPASDKKEEEKSKDGVKPEQKEPELVRKSSDCFIACFILLLLI